VVIGATGTIGRAAAQALVDRSTGGDRVTLVARGSERLTALAAALGPRATPLALDLSREGAAAELAERVPDATGLIFALGSFPRTPLATASRADFAAAVTEHCAIFVECTRALAPALARAGGGVVGFGDDGVERPFPNHIAYLAAKGALTAAARALSLELAGGPAGPVRVGIVAIGVVTDPELDDPVRRAALASRSRLGRTGTPEEVAHVALAMLDATWVSGEIWHVGR
jgi:pteridine reductase